MRILNAILATLASLTMSIGIAQAVSAPTSVTVAPIALQPLYIPSTADRLDPIQPIRYRHGDVSWLPGLAKQAGWPDGSIKQLTLIVLREGWETRRGTSREASRIKVQGPGVASLSKRNCALSMRANWLIAAKSRHRRVK